MKIPMYVLDQRVTVIPFVGVTAYGPTWESDPNKFRKNVPCRLDPVFKRTKGQTGDDVVQQIEGTFHPDHLINIGDKIEWMGKIYTVESLTPIYAMGLHHWEVVLNG